MWIFEESGLSGAFRTAHVMVAVMWMGMLWFFNVVQVPAYAEMEAGARNNAIDKLTNRALWWFRHAAWMTVVSGLVIMFIGGFGDGDVYSSTFFKSPPGMMFAAAVLAAVVMLYNVWMVIWPNQQIVIANARAVQEGKDADPAAPAAARKAAMASRQNTIFSFTVFVGMVGTQHFFGGYDPAEGGIRALFYIVALAYIGLMEINALGVFGTEAGKPNCWMYDKHQNAIWFASGTIVFWVLFFEIFLGKLEGL
jgi:uncharacterized membrane protein